MDPLCLYDSILVGGATEFQACPSISITNSYSITFGLEPQ